MSWIVQAVGVFYVLAGIVVLRQMALERLLDQALAAITMRPASALDRRETQLLSLGGYLTFASGLSALTLSRWSVALFAMASLAQALYLVWAARATPPQDETERKGRRATFNAFLIYLAASAFVIYAAWHGAVRPWPFLDPGFATALAELGAKIGRAHV